MKQKQKRRYLRYQYKKKKVDRLADLTHEEQEQLAWLRRARQAELQAEHHMAIPAEELIPRYIVVGYTEDHTTEINDIQERDVV